VSRWEMELIWHEVRLVKLEAGFIRFRGMVRVRLLPCRSCWLVTGIREWWKRFGAIRRVSLNGSLNKTRALKVISVLLIYRNLEKAFQRSRGLRK
jgi:hypothetical protein